LSEQPGVIPMMAYADGVAAMDWLMRVFGFRERDRRVTPEGRLAHGELDTGHGLIMLATPSVANAWSLARAQASAHHGAFPGPPVPARFKAALISTEDHRFASEPGFDPFALGRVALSFLTGKDQGGATLYQQLAKLL